MRALRRTGTARHQEPLRGSTGEGPPGCSASAPRPMRGSRRSPSSSCCDSAHPPWRVERGTLWKAARGGVLFARLAPVRVDVRYARSSGAAIAYQVVGHGPADLVFVPDYMSNLVYGWEWPRW